MRKTGIVMGLAALALGLTAALAQTPRPAGKNPVPSADAVRFFETQVRPILKAKCFSCHGEGANLSGALRLTNRAALLKGGSSGPAVNLEKPQESLLLKAVRYEGRQMPPTGQLSQASIDILTRWVQMGLPWTEGDKGEPAEAVVKHGPPQVNAETKRFWSFQPVKQPAVPKVKNSAWVKNPIDAFILAKLEAAGLTPNGPANKTALLRRACYDLTGLPPTPEMVKAFLADASPNAYEKVIDRLLASPQYGEKWGRHWLDLVHYAETNSYERDGPKPNAWRYRDYVIQAFNQDKPYNQFLMEQLAGDELPEQTPERLIATGYYRMGIWDDEPSDPKQALYDDLDDIVSTTGQVFLGLTVGCARCHDHKLDPLPQKDYYRFLSFFDGVNRFGGHVQRPIVPEAEQKQHREEIAAHEAKVRANREESAALEKRVMDDLQPVEKEEFKHENARASLLKKRVPKLLSQAEYERYLTLRQERQELAKFQPKALATALCVTEDPVPRVTHVLLRGNPHAEGEEVTPGFPQVLNAPAPTIAKPASGDTSGRRLALARWLADKDNPLTARVIVNRVWQYHFGRGIVRTPSNFGFQGTKPTHPELLDWLAAVFTAGVGDRVSGVEIHHPPAARDTETQRKEGEGKGKREKGKEETGTDSILNPTPDTRHPTPFACGWQFKKLHKLILLSNTYRQAATANPRALAKDPENDLFWRFDMRRLEAEEVRDSILAVNGSLNLKMGGPSIYPSIPAEVLAGQSRPGDGWGKSSPEDERRRSVYIYVKRSLITPMIASFDGPETDFTCPVRFATTQPTQALGMMNSAFVNQQAQVFADYLIQQAGADPTAQVTLALKRVLQREPTLKEIARGVLFISSTRSKQKVEERESLRLFCVIALNLNEFIYLD